MADNFHVANMLAEYSLNLLRGQMITQLMTGQSLYGGGVSLAEFILGKAKEPARRSGTDMMNDALTGLMRSDAAMLRQASKNMLQGKALLETGGDAIVLIQEKIERMKEIAAAIIAGDPNAVALEREYTALVADIDATIKGTEFNGIKLLDGEKWADDERITQNGGTGKLQLQAGYAPSELTLYDLSSYKMKFGSYGVNDLDGWRDAANVLGEADIQLEGMANSYKARAGLLDSEAASFERRADILDEATGRAKPGDEESLKQAIIDILMRNTGSLLQGIS